VRELPSLQPFEKMLVGQVAKHLAQLLFDQIGGRECGDVIVISLRQRDRPELAGPRVDVLEQIRVNPLEILGVKVSLERIGLQYR
jgi:hypothetical protein